MGGVVFNKLEADATRELSERSFTDKSLCVSKLIESRSQPSAFNSFVKNPSTSSYSSTDASLTEEILRCFKTEVDVRSQWSFVTATLYGFGIITTLGYNRIAPITLTGRLFCVAYGLCGIPLTMIIIANLGQYISQFASAGRKNLEEYRRQRLRRRRSRLSIRGVSEEVEDSSIEVMSCGLLIAFILYIGFGAILLPLMNGELDFFNGIYFNFLCLTAIDFGMLVPKRVAFLPITFIYVCMGLALTTIAIDIGSEYLKKLHNFGKKVTNVASAKIWFGGKTLKVRDLLQAVGKKCGVDPAMIEKLDLENIVERTVAINEGRDPPPDLNEEPPLEQSASPPLIDEDEPPDTPPSPPPPPTFIIRKAEVDTVSTRSEPKSSLETIESPLLPRSCSTVVAINMEPEMEVNEQAFLEWEEPRIVIERLDAAFIVEIPDDIAQPEQIEVNANVPAIHLDIIEEPPSEEEPKKFKEKKKKYAKDPQKLHETYKEEWDRLERAGKRIGPVHRKSVLSLTSPTSTITNVPTFTSGVALGGSDGWRQRRQSSRPNTPTSSSTATTGGGGGLSPTTGNSPTPASQRHASLAPQSTHTHNHLYTPPITSRSGSMDFAYRRSSSSVGIKKLSPQTYKKFGELVIGGGSGSGSAAGSRNGSNNDISQ